MTPSCPCSSSAAVDRWAYNLLCSRVMCLEALTLLLLPSACMNCLESESRLANTSTNFFLIKKFGGWIPQWFSGKESACHCRKHRFDPWSRKIPHAVEQLHVPQLLSLCPRACAPRQEQPPQWEAHARQLESSPHSSQLEKSLSSNEDPAHSKTK